MLEKFATISRKTATAAGSWQAFMAAFGIVLAWIVGGFFVGFTSELYQLLINTTTTIITFLMVFLIQGSANRDQAAIQIKLDEILCALDKASDTLIDIENGTDQDIADARDRIKASSSAGGGAGR